MKNTNDNKQSFFAQYWNQPILLKGRFGNLYQNINLHWGLPSDFVNRKLILKPLSSITDEDAIEVCKMINCASFAFSNKKWVVNHVENDNASYCEITSNRSVHRFEIDYDGFIHMKDEETHQLPIMALPDYLSAFDYLRSRGYAIPFMGLTVKEMKQYGWIKLKK